MLARKKKWETNLGSECKGSEGESMAECEGSEGESMPEYEGSDIGNGLDIGDEDGLFGDVMGLSAMVFVLVWVQNRRERLSASVAKAVVNGSQRLGLGLGSDYREWLLATVWELLATY